MRQRARHIPRGVCEGRGRRARKDVPSKWCLLLMKDFPQNYTFLNFYSFLCFTSFLNLNTTVSEATSLYQPGFCPDYEPWHALLGRESRGHCCSCTDDVTSGGKLLRADHPAPILSSSFVPSSLKIKKNWKYSMSSYYAQETSKRGQPLSLSVLACFDAI